MAVPGGPTLTTINISAPSPGALARFYSRLLGWPIAVEEPDWVLLRDPAGGVGIAVQTETDYQRPTWPATAGAHAAACGATLAGDQPQDDVRVYLDPAGHPFCLWTE